MLKFRMCTHTITYIITCLHVNAHTHITDINTLRDVFFLSMFLYFDILILLYIITKKILLLIPEFFLLLINGSLRSAVWKVLIS